MIFFYHFALTHFDFIFNYSTSTNPFKEKRGPFSLYFIMVVVLYVCSFTYLILFYFIILEKDIFARDQKKKEKIYLIETIGTATYAG